jgi:pyridoxamine 5'-phosphate oxidase
MSGQELGPDPIATFAEWYEEACNSNAEILPDAMVLSTATADGVPSSRTVLLKEFDPAGFVFVTSYESQKGRQLEENPRAALLFHWQSLDRQVRIEGAVARTSTEDSTRMFDQRPLKSRHAAMASPQSQDLESREELEAMMENVVRRFPGEHPPRPESWGGYRLTPGAIEFWIRGEHRLHDRFLFERSDDGWTQRRLAP